MVSFCHKTLSQGSSNLKKKIPYPTALTNIFNKLVNYFPKNVSQTSKAELPSLPFINNTQKKNPTPKNKPHTTHFLLRQPQRKLSLAKRSLQRADSLPYPTYWELQP